MNKYIFKNYFRIKYFMLNPQPNAYQDNAFHTRFNFSIT